MELGETLTDFFSPKHPSFPAGVSCRQENFSYSHRSVFFLSWLPASRRQDGQFVNDLSTCWRCFEEEGNAAHSCLLMSGYCGLTSEAPPSHVTHTPPPADSLLRRRRRRGGTGLWPNSGHTAGCTSRQLLPVMKNTVWVSAAQEICRSLTAVKVDKRFYEVSSDSLFYSCLLKSYPRVCFPPWVRPPRFELFTQFPLKWCSVSKIPTIWHSCLNHPSIFQKPRDGLEAAVSKWQGSKLSPPALQGTPADNTQGSKRPPHTSAFLVEKPTLSCFNSWIIRCGGIISHQAGILLSVRNNTVAERSVKGGQKLERVQLL